jgi:hypothetical protein
VSEAIHWCAHPSGHNLRPLHLSPPFCSKFRESEGTRRKGGEGGGVYDVFVWVVGLVACHRPCLDVFVYVYVCITHTHTHTHTHPCTRAHTVNYIKVICLSSYPCRCLWPPRLTPGLLLLRGLNSVHEQGPFEQCLAGIVGIFVLQTRRMQDKNARHSS